jgi:hypothetical protein
MLVDLLDQQHSTVITRCLSPVSMAEKGSTSDHWSIYRNLIDLRVPTAGRRPRWVGDTAVWRFGTMFKSNEKTAPDGPYDLFHNTFLVNDQVFEQPAQAAYVHYRSGLSPHRRRSFNNIFVAVNPDPTADIPIAFVPPPSFPGPTDGNLYHRIGDATAPAFSVVDYDLDCVHHPGQTFETLCDLRHSALFEQSKTQYPPGYEATSLLTDPQFQHLAADGAFDPQDDLRLAAGSPALSAGIPLPPDLQDLDDSLESPPAIPSRDIGCYRSGSPPLRVGVNGQRRFPGVPPP